MGDDDGMGPTPCGANATGGVGGAIGFGSPLMEGARACLPESASEAPQNLQNWAAESTTPRHRLHVRTPPCAAGAPCPRSTTRAGAMASGGAGIGAGAA